jgi:AAA+ ATPase superfamily predicted ATPase
MVERFVGREHELQRLCALIERDSSGIAVVYGRRRIGKSLLLRKAFDGQRVLIFEGLENRPKQEQIQNFLFQLSAQTDMRSSPVRSWREALLQLHAYIRDRPHHIVLDEFQWMANYRRDMISDLKLMWDQFLYQVPGTTLVLCGSIASFMTSKVIRSTALYGRVDLQIHLRAFELHESAQMLPQLGQQEVLDAHLLTGGVPKYLDLLQGRPSVHLGIEAIAFDRDGYWFHEFDRIFVSHFGRNDDYLRLVRALAEQPLGLSRSSLAARAGVAPGGHLSTQLQDLEAAGFIDSYVPIDRGLQSKTIRYYLSDAYLRFYFAFIQPRRKDIASGLQRDLFTRVRDSGAFYPWMGRAFEYCCVQHARWFVDHLGFSGVAFSAGPWFRSQQPGFQVDLVFDRADQVLTLCEMKYAMTPIGKEVIPEVERKIERMAPLVQKKTVQKVLVTRSPPTRELKTAGYFYRIIEAHELLTP